jgi:hypothetical protein
MGLLAQLRSFLAGFWGGREPTAALPAPAGVRYTGPREVINDAVAYGVAIEPVTPAPGAWYWQAVRVHHLTPDENGGNHHIYLDMLDAEVVDAASPQGQRVHGARAKVQWADGEQTITIDKPLSEPGANFPMWKWQVCSALGLGLPGQELPSDRVTGMHTGHPDEAPGNTLFHHSFLVTFCRVQAGGAPRSESVIAGKVRGGAGRVASLRQGETATAQQTLLADEAFRFTGLAAGEYVVAVDGTDVRSPAVTVDGVSQATVELTLPPTAAGKPLTHYVLFGGAGRPAAETSLILAQEYLLAFRPAFGFSPAEAAGAAQVTILADTATVSAETEVALRAGGAAVQRIAGTVEQVAAALAERVARGQPF